MTKIKVDCHSHTSFSFDGAITPAQYVEQGKKRGLGAAIICDHNTIEGALEVKALNPSFEVIVSEEIFTSDGELIAAFINEKIPSEKSYSWTIDAIHEQGGLAIVPHPFVHVVRSRVKTSILFECADKVDAVEIHNARNEYLADELTARGFSRLYNIPGTAGSDGHLAHTLGRGYVLMEPFNDAQTFLKNLAGGMAVCERRTPLWLSTITFFVPFFGHIYNLSKKSIFKTKPL